MTTPFDEDDPTPKATPGRRPAPPAKAPKPAGAVPAEPAGPERLAWGHVGSVTRPGRLSDGTSRPGVVRIVEAGISYDPPPLEPYVWAQASLNYVGQYEMAWPEGDPAQVRSLADLVAELQGGKPSATQLKTLDNVAESLLGIAERLHECGWRLGLIHPGNVLIVPGSQGREIVLPDLGFVWRGSHGEFPWTYSPGRPRWLDDDVRQNAHVRLWDEEPARRQFPNAEAAGEDAELVPEQSDVKTLARIFAAVLTGRVERDPAPPPNAPPVWGVLRAALTGAIPSATELRSPLAQHPLSEHWTKPSSAAPKKSGAIGVLGCLGLLAVVGGGFVLVNHLVIPNLGPNAKTDFRMVGTGQDGPSKTSAEPRKPAHVLDKREVDWKTRPQDSPPEIVDTLNQLDAAKDPKQVLALLESLYSLYERSDEAMRDKIRPWVEYWRGQYLDGWEARYRQADDAVIKNIGQRYEAGRQIHELHQELAGLREQYEPISPSLDERERACLLISELRSRELGSPR